MAQGTIINRMKKIGVLLGVCATMLLGTMTQKSFALQLNPTPDIKVETWVEYFNNNGTNNFTALGYALKYNGATDYFNNLSYFDLFASINSSGTLTGGTLAIYDDSDQSNAFTAGENLYLSGDLTNLMFTLGDPVLNFLFTPTGGILKDAYGSTGGIILAASGFNTASGGFNSNFGTYDVSGALTNSAQADVGTPVPEPSSICLLLLGAGGLFFIRRRKS